MEIGKTVVLLLAWCSASDAWGLFKSVSDIVASVGGGMVDQTYCRLTECCSDRSVPANMKELRYKLEQSVFGQHIVMERLIPALEAHLNKINNSRKPLVISFQGPSGTGKNFVSQKIAEALYAKGLKSSFVRYYRGRADFPIASKVEEYNAQINMEVRKSLAACSHSLFIFDEVDNMPAGIFSALTSLVDYNTIVDGYDSSRAIFILLSNIGGEHISDRLGNLLKAGTLRRESKMLDFEQILKKAAYNLDGGMKKSSLIDTYVIDHYIPFLPLEKEHVVRCIAEEFKRRDWLPNSDDIEYIVKESVEYDPTHGIFVKSGCKTIAPKVSWYVHHKALNQKQDL